MKYITLHLSTATAWGERGSLKQWPLITLPIWATAQICILIAHSVQNQYKVSFYRPNTNQLGMGIHQTFCIAVLSQIFFQNILIIFWYTWTKYFHCFLLFHFSWRKIINKKSITSLWICLYLTIHMKIKLHITNNKQKNNSNMFKLEFFLFGRWNVYFWNF